MKGTIIAIIALVGIGCIGFAVFGTPYFINAGVEDSKSLVLPDVGGTNMTLTHTTKFHLDFNQGCIIKIYVHQNATFPTDEWVNLMILRADIYAQNGTGFPDSVGTAYGLVTSSGTINYPAAPGTLTNGTTTILLDSADQGTTTRVEFMGGPVVSNSLSSIPVDYVAVIWANDTANPDNTYITIDLKIELTGLSGTLNTWFTLIGVALLAVAGVLVIMYIRKEGR